MVARSTGWHTFRIVYASGSLYVYYDGVLRASGSFEHVVSAAGIESTTASDFFIRNLSFTVYGGASMGPYYTDVASGSGSGFSITVYSGTAYVDRVSHSETITVPGPAPGDRVVLGKPLPT